MTWSGALSRGLRSDIDRRVCESVDADSLDSCLRNRESDAPDEMYANFF